MKVSELKAEVLDYWVGVAQNKEMMIHDLDSAFPPDRERIAVIVPPEEFAEEGESPYLPSYFWKDCGPLIEKYGIWLSDDGSEDEPWTASVVHVDTDDSANIQYGANAREAICRAVVAYHYGKETPFNI